MDMYNSEIENIRQKLLKNINAIVVRQHITECNSIRNDYRSRRDRSNRNRLFALVSHTCREIYLVITYALLCI